MSFLTSFIPLVRPARGAVTTHSTNRINNIRLNAWEGCAIVSIVSNQEAVHASKFSKNAGRAAKPHPAFFI